MIKAARVAFSGSGFKFPALVGGAVAFADAGIEIIEVAGTSGGSIVAALFASGMPLKDMVDLTMHNDWSRMLSFNLSALFQGGWCTGNVLEKWIDKSTFGASFNDLRIPCTIVASDASTETGFIFNKKLEGSTKLSFAARCSASIPAVYAAKKYKGALLQDGGMVNNIPVDLLVKDEVPRFGIQLISKTSPLTNGRTDLLNLLLRDLNMMLSANENTHVEEDIMEGASFSFVETGFANSLNRNMSQPIRQQLFDAGYNTTIEMLKKCGHY